MKTPSAAEQHDLVLDKERKLPIEFYTRDALIVANELLGKIFIRRTKENLFAGIITEVEAYKGAVDESAHSYGGETERNSVMFEEGGRLYVYFIYGVHYCANVVTGSKGEGDAVLLRAMRPIYGIDKMALNRFGKINLRESEFTGLLNGPAKICKAMEIAKSENGESLLGENVFIIPEDSSRRYEIGVSKRIGISKSKSLPWRFFIKNSKFVSA